jgi:hypothetical protein
MKAKFKKISKFFAKAGFFLLKNHFLTCLILFIIALGLGALIFYKYCILEQQKEINISEKSLWIKEDTYSRIESVWQENERRFLEADSKEYKNPFVPLSSTAKKE